MGQRQQCKRIQEQVKDYASNLQGDAGLRTTNMYKQTATGEQVDVNLYPEIPVIEEQPLEDDKINEMKTWCLRTRS